MTRRPPEVGLTDRTRFVWMLRAPSTLAVVWYIQVLPTAMGKEIEPVGTNAFEFAFGVVTGLAFAVEEVPLDGGTELLAEALHPARATTAATASAALADPNLLISCPALWSVCDVEAPKPPRLRKALNKGRGQRRRKRGESRQCKNQDPDIRLPKRPG